MKREIKFRAIAVSSGEWVYGNFIHSKRFSGCGNEYRIHNQDTGLESDIDIDTLGQYTGLTDKNGVEVYEGDIIYWEDWTPAEFKVAFNRGAFELIGRILLPEIKEDSYRLPVKYVKDFEVIGNIHEQKERE